MAGTWWVGGVSGNGNGRQTGTQCPSGVFPHILPLNLPKEGGDAINIILVFIGKQTAAQRD